MLAACLTLAATAPEALGAGGFGAITGPGGCVHEPGASGAPAQCSAAHGVFHPSAIAVSPDGTSVYVVGGVAKSRIAESFGSIAILARNPATGEVKAAGCLSSDGTDGIDGASGICTPTAGLLGVDGVAVSPDGRIVFVTANASASVVAFARDPATGALTRLGCFQSTPRPGSRCGPANVFEGSDELLAGADGSTLYVASPSQGTLSAFMAPTPAVAAGEGGSGSSGSAAPPASGATPPSSAGLAALFSAPPTTFTNNPCIAVNGYDGSCAVGIAMRGIGALTLSPDGKSLYAIATTSHALDEFAPTPSTPLAEVGCLKPDAPHGLCTPSELLDAPTQLAVSPDGHNVYVADSANGAGKIDILTRNPETGALSGTRDRCVDFTPLPSKPEASEEGEEESAEEKAEKEAQQKEAEKQAAEQEAADPCLRVPGLLGVKTLAVSGDGSAVYAFGSSSAVSFARNASNGALTETGCAGEEDSRCTSIPLKDVEAAAVSPDGKQVYVLSSNGNAVLGFGVGASVTSATAASNRSGIATMSVACPAHLARPCRGRILLTRLVRRSEHHRARRVRIPAGRSDVFAIAAGSHRVVRVSLYPSARALLLGSGRLRVTAGVRAERYAGGSAFGRGVLLQLARR
jgi:DNA-binding beta-propeller fold protein YncE